MRTAVLSGVCLALAMGAMPAGAQTVIGAKSGVINLVEGDVFLNDNPYVMQPSQFGEVKENMVLRTEEGRAEILLPPGVLLRIGENASFKMISNRLIDTRLELLTGSGIVEVDDIDKEAKITVVCKAGTITLSKVGIYRFDTQPAQLKVFKGAAEVEVGGQNLPVSAGKMVTLGAVASVEKFDVVETDTLDHWSRRRAEVLANANVSSAKQTHYGSGSMYGIGMNPCLPGYGGYNTGPFIKPLGSWTYNPYYGFGTYVPCNGMYRNPYGYMFYSPMAVYRTFYAPRPTYNPSPGGGFGSFGSPSYSSMGSSSGGYSGAMSSGPSVSASAPAATSSGSSAASSAGSSSVGHGGGSGGGHGK